MRVLGLGIAVFLAVRSAAKAQTAATLTTVYSFPDTYSNPYTYTAGLIRGRDGNFYGVTFGGGSAKKGSVYRLTPDGQFTTLHSFTGSGEGYLPSGALVQTADGNLYGVTQGGDLGAGGTIFRLSPDGTLTTLHHFSTSDYNVCDPQAGLIQATDGNFYGSTYGVFTYGSGVLFRITPAGDFSVLSNVGGAPALPVQSRDGNLYGTSYFSGFAGPGDNFYRVSLAGAYQGWYIDSDDPSWTAQPAAGLVEGADGNFYGASFDPTTIYRMTPQGHFTALRTLADYEGTACKSPLVQAADGTFYGVTAAGGANGKGAVFQITPTGSFTSLYAFTDSEGSVPNSNLVPDGQGNFYGVTSTGGAYGNGTIFKLSIVKHPAFFAGQIPLGNSVDYLAFPNGNPFGYYAFLGDSSSLYHFDLGFEYVLDAADGHDGVYLYDFTSNTFFYTSPTFPFPYLYDFTLNAFLYYFPDPTNPQRYNTNGVRYFYNFSTGKIISK